MRFGAVLDGPEGVRYRGRMTTQKKPTPPTPRNADRQSKLKDALKANLARRKAQAKARARDEA